MKLAIQFCTSFVFALTLCACDPVPPSHAFSRTSPNSKIEEYQLLSLSRAMVNSETIGGEAYLQFTQPLNGLNSKEHYLLEFDTFSDGGEVTLHSHFNGFQHLDGVQLILLRQGKDLKVSVVTPGYYPRDLTTLSGLFDRTQRAKLRFEIHDGLSSDGVQIFIWNDLVNLRGREWAGLERITEQNAVFSSRSQMFPTHGRGVYWGLHTKNVLVNGASRDMTYVP